MPESLDSPKRIYFCKTFSGFLIAYMLTYSLPFLFSAFNGLTNLAHVTTGQVICAWGPPSSKLLLGFPAVSNLNRTSIRSAVLAHLDHVTD